MKKNSSMPVAAPRETYAGRLRRRIGFFFSDPRLHLRLQAGVSSALAVGLFLSFILLSEMLAPLDRPLTDLLYQPAKPSGQVAVIAIDTKSLDEIGPWPWSRSVHSALVQQLSTAVPRVIAFDVPFAQPEEEDAGFAATIRRAGNVVLTTVGVNPAAYPPRANSFPRFDVLLLPTRELREAAAGVGHRMLVADTDGIVRRVPLAIDASDGRYPALGVAAAEVYLGIKQLDARLAQRRVVVGSEQIHVDEFGQALLNFPGAREGLSRYSYSEVLKGVVPASTFAGKIVFIGGVATTETETYATPLSSGNNVAHNVLIEAALADMLVSRPPHSLRLPEPLPQVAITFLVALLAGLTLPHLRPLSAGALTLLYLLGVFVLAFMAFDRGIIIKVLYPALALSMIFGLVATFRYLSEERKRQFLTVLFRRYLPAESVGRVVDAVDRGELPLAGTRRNVTVLYADLRGFAALSEGLAPEAVLGLVNRYLELMLRAIQTENGTVSKPMGDALVAIWNAPLDQPDHARRAVRAAVSIRKRITRFQKGRSDEQSVNFGLGLATGFAVLGNINALGKVEYTLVGETVNVAARISAFAGNNQILADATTAADAPTDVAVRELTPVRVRGRREPLPVWEIREPVEVKQEEEEEEEGLFA